jgi:hypothetical protein
MRSATRLGIAVLLLSMLVWPQSARADHFFLFPEVGIGYGRAILPDGSGFVGTLDLHFGTEWDLGGPRAAVGWLLNLGYLTFLEDEEHAAQLPKWWRIHFAPMLTLSSGYNWWTLFARVGIGPHFAYSRRGDTGYYGGGLQLEGAIGSKNAIELFAQSYVSFDAKGPNLTLVGGLRLNIVAFIALMDLFHGHSPRVPFSHHEARPAP